MISLTADYKRLVTDWLSVAESGKYAEGSFVSRLETAVSQRHRTHSAVLNSCGSGLFAIARLLKKKDVPQTVIVPTNSFFATGAMFQEAGWNVVLADCALDDFCLTVESLHSAIRRATSPIAAVVLTHVGGMALRYKEIAAFCEARRWDLIEDCAHVLGVRHNGLQPGDLGVAAAFSMYPTKGIPAGEGGIVISRYPGLIEEVKQFRSYGKKTDSKGVIRYTKGFNLRMDEWNAVVALAQFEMCDVIIAERAECAERLKRVIEPVTTWRGATNWYKYTAPYDFPAKKQTGKIYALSDQLSVALGIGGRFPSAERVAKTHICLPVGVGLYAGMSSGDIEQYLTMEG